MNILERFSENINGTLSTFDRIIINGYLMCLQNPRHFLYYLIQKGVKLVDFKPFAESMTARLCSHVEKFAEDNGCRVQYLKSPKNDKSSIAKGELRKLGGKEGLVAAFSCLEYCTAMTVKKDAKTKLLAPASEKTKSKWYYLYFNDREFGWMFFKIQSYFPFNVQVYINGREYMSRLLDSEGISYTMYDNSFSHISDFARAQEIADRMLGKKISSSFDGIAKKINPHLSDIEGVMSHTYYWCTEACEFATDITFDTRSTLGSFYKRLVESTYFSFSCDDVYSFFGRKARDVQKFRGESVSDLRNRYQGYQVKFRLGSNQVKMYDKANSLRIEVTINDPKQFKVFRRFDEQTGEEKDGKWVPMGKRQVCGSQQVHHRQVRQCPSGLRDRGRFTGRPAVHIKGHRGRRKEIFRIQCL